jgi:DNA-binding NtrC family response regulator
MRYPQIILFEADAAIVQGLQAMAEARKWLLRQPRQAPACLTLLQVGGPAVLVLKIGRHLIRELTILDQIHESLPDVPVVVVADAEDYLLLRLAMELGASFVLMPPQSRHDLPEIVVRLMEATIRRAVPDEAERSNESMVTVDIPVEEPPLEPDA